MANKNIERKIVIGLIASTEYVRQVRDYFNPRLIESSMAKRIAAWCIEFFDKYAEAPGITIIDIYYQKLKRGLPKEVAEEIEQDILPDLNEEFLKEGLNIPHLIDQTKEFFLEKSIRLHNQQVEALLDEGKTDEAEALAASYHSLVPEKDSSINFQDRSSLEAVEKAFAEAATPLITFPKQLGEFWNHQLVEGGFVALMGSEKRGKTFWLMELAKRGVKCGMPVAFFQAGDMSESAQIRRFCINIAKKSDLEKYCGEMYEPVRDCVFNQRGDCSRPERECDGGIFENMPEKQIRKEITLEDLKQAYEDNPEYKPCWNCKEYKQRHWGAAWVRKIEVKNPIGINEAKRIWRKFFIRNKRSLMLSTHANGTLTVHKIKSILHKQRKETGFVPRIIIVDYADLLVASSKQDFRHQQNEIWKELRSLSQEEVEGHFPLVITVTQADADSYTKDLLSLKNFSEDKRKYAHVTAMYGLNQDPFGREKKIGIMRINEIVVREGDFSVNNVIHVLQNLKRGQPFLGSYF